MEQAEAPRNPDEQISLRVRAALQERGISGSELSRRLGFTQSYVSRRLRDDVPWRAADVEAIARELHISAGRLLDDSSASAA